MSRFIACLNCGKENITNSNWWVCGVCSFRVCMECFTKHKGKYSNGGYKCSRCVNGYMKLQQL